MIKYKDTVLVKDPFYQEQEFTVTRRKTVGTKVQYFVEELDTWFPEEDLLPVVQRMPLTLKDAITIGGYVADHQPRKGMTFKLAYIYPFSADNLALFGFTAEQQQEIIDNLMKKYPDAIIVNPEVTCEDQQ